MTFFMDTILIFSIVVCFFFIIRLIMKREAAKKIHANKINQLKKRIQILTKEQRELSDKTLISSEYSAKHKADMNRLNEEILALQKNIFELLVNK